MVAIGIVGAAMAAICAIVAGIAIIRGAGGLSGGAVGLWIMCALVSVTASFGNQWVPLFASCAALVAMLVIGGVVRAMVGATELGREPRHERFDAASPPPVRKAPVAVPVSTSTVAVVR
jgi:uncharacterized membrane protein YhaH (DUF805 family)